MVYKSTHTNNDNDNPLLNDIKFTVQMFDSVFRHAVRYAYNISRNIKKWRMKNHADKMDEFWPLPSSFSNILIISRFYATTRFFNLRICRREMKLEACCYLETLHNCYLVRLA